MVSHIPSHASSSYQLPFVMLVIALLLLGISGWQHNPHAQAQTTEWSEAERLTSSGADSVGPDIVTDTQGVSHIVYTETDFGSVGNVYYINNRTGAWSTPVQISIDTRTEPGGGNKAVSIASYTLNGTTHLGVAYQARRSNGSRRILVRESPDGGVTWGEVEVATTHTSLHPSLIYDDTFQPHLVYVKGGNDELKAYYTTRINGVWTAEEIENDVDRNPDITYTRDASGGLWLHVFYQTASSFNAGQDEIRIISRYRTPAGVWSGIADRDRNIAQYPKLASDHIQTIFAVWSAKDEEADIDIDPFFAISADTGQTWSGPQSIGTRTEDLGQRPAIARSPATGELMVVWEDDYEADEFKYDIFYRTSSDNGATWSQFGSVFQANGGSGSTNLGATPTGGFRAVWDDGVDGKIRVLTSGYNDMLMPGTPGPTTTTTPDANATVTSTPTATTTPDPNATATPTPTATTTPDAGATVTPSPTATTMPDPGGVPVVTISVEPAVASSPNISVTITATGADLYQLSNDGLDFTDAGYQPLPSGSATVPWTLAPLSEPDAEACTIQTVYARVKDSVSGVESEIALTTVKRDTGVDVTVSALNPYLVENDLSLQDFGGAGASDGDPGFTRTGFYMLEVRNNGGECSGLAEVNVGTSRSLRGNELSSITQVTVPFDAFELVDGIQTVTITVTDNAGNSATYTPLITLDTNAPMIASDNATIRATPASITDELPIVDVVFENLVITDTYRHPQNTNQQFWGVWLANSTEQITITDTASLDELIWKPVEVAGASDPANFTVSGWSLANGFWEIIEGGEFYVYARVLDGAGNASVRTLESNAIQVQSNVIPIPDDVVYLPLIGS